MTRASHSWTRELYGVNSDSIMSWSDADGVVAALVPFSKQVLESKRIQGSCVS